MDIPRLQQLFKNFELVRFKMCSYLQQHDVPPVGQEAEVDPHGLPAAALPELHAGEVLRRGQAGQGLGGEVGLLGVGGGSLLRLGLGLEGVVVQGLLRR